MSTYNPFNLIGKHHAAGLEYIATALITGPSPTIVLDDIIHASIDFVKTLYPDELTALNELELSIIATDVLNSYTSGLARFGPYSATQQKLIYSMVQSVNSVPFDSIDRYLLTIDDDIISKGIPINEQNPLLLASAIGRYDFQYWVAQIGTTSIWDEFIERPGGEAVYCKFYMNAAVESVLISSSRENRNYVGISGIKLGFDTISSLTSSLVVVSSMVFFKLYQKP